MSSIPGAFTRSTCGCADSECEHRQNIIPSDEQTSLIDDARHIVGEQRNHDLNDLMTQQEQTLMIEETHHTVDEQHNSNLNNLKRPLELSCPEYLSYHSDLIRKVNESDMNEEDKRKTIELMKLQLESKQCNESYEVLLSNCLGLRNNPEKHGIDATSPDGNEVYEFKPSKIRIGGTINDDSISKIEKCEQYITDGLQGYLIMARINLTTYSFDAIYKFDLKIYNEDRRNYVMTNIKKNQTTNTRQTRSTYNISLPKSIKLTKQFNLPYYVWTRDE